MEKLNCRLPINQGHFSLPSPPVNWEASLTTDQPQLYINAASREENNLFWDDGLLIVVNGAPRQDDQQLNAYAIASLYRQQPDAFAGQVANQFSGHFRLLLIDEKRQHICCLTDKFATLPIYYQVDEDQLLIFGQLSALKQQHQQPLEIAPQSLYHYLYFHCIPSPLTIYQDIYKLPPARLLTWQTGQLNETLYWQPEFATRLERSSSDYEAELRGELTQSMARFADDPHTGTFLSGGLDSSAVAGFLARTSSRRIDTFTIGFSEPGYDETEFAEVVANRFNTRHHVYQMTPKDLYQQLPAVTSYFDEPFGNSSSLPTFYCSQLAKSHGMTRLLAGDGGDELFAGNSRYAKQKIFEYYYQLPAGARQRLEQHMPSLAQKLSHPLVKKAASYVEQAAIKLPMRLQHYNFLHQYPVEQVFTARIRSNLDLGLPENLLEQRYGEVSPASAIDNMLYLDWKFTLADNDLVKVNNMTAKAGIDVAYPMLDEGILALSTRLPGGSKLPGQNLRAFYKRALSGILPHSTLTKSKQGFGLPFGKWLSKDPQLNALVNDSLQRLKQRDIIEPAFIDLALTMHQQVHASFFGELVWLMMSLELWLDAHFDQSPPTESQRQSREKTPQAVL